MLSYGLREVHYHFVLFCFSVHFSISFLLFLLYEFWYYIILHIVALSFYHYQVFSCFVFWFSVNSSMSDINIIRLMFLFVFACITFVFFLLFSPIFLLSIFCSCSWHYLGFISWLHELFLKSEISRSKLKKALRTLDLFYSSCFLLVGQVYAVTTHSEANHFPTIASIAAILLL